MHRRHQSSPVSRSGPVDVAYLLYWLRIDGEPNDLEFTVPVPASLSLDEARRHMDGSDVFAHWLAEWHGPDRLAGRAWEIIDCQRIDAATHRRLFPGHAAWTGGVVDVGVNVPAPPRRRRLQDR